MHTTVLGGVCLTFAATLIYKKNAFFFFFFSLFPLYTQSPRQYQNDRQQLIWLVEFVSDKNKPKGQETSLELKLNL